MGRRRVVAVVIWTAFSRIKTRPHTSLYSPSRGLCIIVGAAESNEKDEEEVLSR